MKKLTIALVAVVVSVTGAFAGTSAKTFKETVAPAPDCKFRDQELQVDAFAAGGFYSTGRPYWGGGLGVNYFVNKYIGIGVEQGIGGRGSNAEWATVGNFFLRYPFCFGFAPYAMVGGGCSYGTGDGHGFGHVGGGLEYRVTDNIGLFSDARYIYSSEEPQNGVLGRAGLRFAF